MPRGMAAHPHLASKLLRLRNAWRHKRGRMLLAAALIVAGCAAAAVAPPMGSILGWLGRNCAVAFVIATCLFALAAARRRQRA
jgi:hypothetical protein